MLAKGKKRVNGKCVLLCTIEEVSGQKITIMTHSQFLGGFWRQGIILKIKVITI
jgi:hypothetical protein